MTVEAIKEAISQLSRPDRQRLATWFDELQEDVWDRQMEEDFAPGGRGAHLLEKVNREIDAGRFTSLTGGFRERRERKVGK